MKKFGSGRDLADTIQFEVDGETFDAVGPTRLPGMALVDLAQLATLEDRWEQLHVITEFLDMALTAESGARFAGRLRDPDRPISLDTASDVVTWLVEEVYTGHPTQPSSASSAGLAPTTPGSMGGVSLTE